MTYLVLAGIHNSGPLHWQSIWQQEMPDIVKLEHSSWTHPNRHVWVKELEQRIESLGPTTVLVAHSLACLMVAHWASQSTQKVKGALLVSVPDPEGPHFPSDAKSFGQLPMARWSFPSIVVSSDNDPYGSRVYMEQCASAWGSEFVPVSGLGHINADSRLGSWPLGKKLLRQIAG